MSSIIKISTKINFGVKFTNYYTDKTSDSTTLFIGDAVDNLEYLEESVSKKISGKIIAIDPVLIGVSKTYDIENDIKISSITIESFTVEKTQTVITTDNLVAYSPDNGKEFNYLGVTSVMNVDFDALYSDGHKTTDKLEVGMDLNNVQFQKTDSVIKGNYIIKAFLYKINRVNYNYNIPIVHGMLLEGATIEQVMFGNIKSFGSEGIQVEADEDINDVIASTTDFNMIDILLPVADFPEALSINKDVNFVGNEANVSASVGDRRSDEIDDSETVLMNTITCEKNTNVIFNGITFTDNVYIDPNGATSLTFKNCKFVETEPNAVKSYLFNDRAFRSDNDKPLLLQFENCYFGTNTTFEDKKMYNLLEIHSKLANGSYIKNCYFAKECTTHNIINLYDVEDGATIEISGNHFEKSANAIRVGFINHPKCKLIIQDNTYDETDSDANWAGLLLVQPYGAQTETFQDVTIEMKNNKYLNGTCQDGYLYFNSKDTQITKETAPIVNTDGHFNFGFE